MRRTKRVWHRPAVPSAAAPTVGRPDLRTREGKAFERTRRGLVAQLGGKPTLTQELLVHRVAAIAVRTARLDREVAESGSGTDATTTEYIRLIGLMDRLLERLGLGSGEQKPPEPSRSSLADYLRQKRRKAGDAAAEPEDASHA